MTTAKVEKGTGKAKPGQFITYQEVEVEIESRDLERAGWVWAGEPATDVDRLARLIEVRHDDEHEGPFRFCTDALCKEVGHAGGAH